MNAIGLIILLANIGISYKGFNNHSFFEGYKFEVDKILIKKDYIRLLSSGFLHVNWQHLIFNMISLYAFSGSIEIEVGSFSFLLIYFASLIGGNLLALYIHRHHGDYSAVGASGAVCGIVFASIALFPGTSIGFFFLPIGIPSWLFGLIYVAYSIYGIKSKRDNIGHEAHLGGALVGMLVAIAIEPSSLTQNYIPILVILLPTLAFIVLIIYKPHYLFVDNLFFKNHPVYFDIDHKYNEMKGNNQRELDKLLDKISSTGIESLSKKERQRLEELSK
ncbi:MAG: rhomboid family intramembrane serine protease [Bacteroidetes bacterium]|nr:rhomboid family intramembrane serine protease [Bacteroidota bacterium]